MIRNDVPSPLDGAFYATVQVDDGVLTLTLSGEAGIEAHALLSSMLSDMHSAALREGTRHVEVDFRALSLMNSMCLKQLVQWLSLLIEGSSYDVRFLSNPRLHWQERSLQALARFAPEVVTLVPDESALGGSPP